MNNDNDGSLFLLFRWMNKTNRTGNRCSRRRRREKNMHERNSNTCFCLYI